MQNAVKLEESTYSELFSISTINDDGTKSIMSFNNPVKYYDDETGNICFINNTFVSATDNNELVYSNVYNDDTTTCESGYDIDCEIYDYNGELIVKDTIIGQVNKKFPVLAGKSFFIKIYNADNRPGEYTITIS